MATFNHNGIEIYYAVQGKGEPLLLIAGLASDSSSWQFVLKKLAESFQVIVFDNRGVGRTRPAEAESSIKLIAEDCVALLKHLEISKAHLLGHSMGSFIAMRCAELYPEFVDKLILAGSTDEISERNKFLLSDWATTLDQGIAPKLWYRTLFYWLFREDFFKKESNLAVALEYSVNYPYPQTKESFRKQVEIISDFKPIDHTSSLSVDTLVVGGQCDLIFPQENSEKLARLIKNANCAIIPDAAHAIHVDNPNGFIECVVGFLCQ